MQYAMLVYFQEPEFFALPPAEQLRLHQACGDWYDALAKSGGSTSCLRLQPVVTATTLRETGSRLMLSDGPFAETKEILGGLVVLECPDLDAAIALARTFPTLSVPGFALELRPVVGEGVYRMPSAAT